MSSFDIPGVVSPAQKTLIRAWWKKVTAANSRTTEPLGDIREADDYEKRVFGAPLSESIMYAHSSISYIDSNTERRCYGVIPTIIAKCGSFLKEEGLMVEGIFRVSGSAKRISMLQRIFNDSEDFGATFNWEGGYTVHDAANVMRRFLNHLPEPVITLDYYRPFKDTMYEEFPSLDAKIEAFQNLIECLPLVHQYLLLYIMDMLGLFAMASDATRMDISALAAVFAPSILSHPDDELNPAGYKESQRVLEFLIEHQHRFSVPRSCLPPEQSLVPRCRITYPAHWSSRRGSTSVASSKPADKIRSDLERFSSSKPLSRSSTVRSSKVTSTTSGLFPEPSSSTSSSLKRSKTVPHKSRPSRNPDSQSSHNQDDRKPSVGRWKSIRLVQGSNI